MKAHAHHIGHSVIKGGLYIGIFALGMPLLYLGTGFLLDIQFGNSLTRYEQVTRLISIPVGLLGFYIIGFAMVELFKKGRGLPLSSSPPDKLVTSGPYRWSRHPIYVGAIMVEAGLFLWFASFWGLVLGLPMLGLFYISYARGIEEPVLQQRYGNLYVQYRENVPLFIPCPFRTGVHRLCKRLLEKLSTFVNRPKIVRRGNHILFWGYGIWPGLGVMMGMGIMEFILLSQGVSGATTAALVIVFSVLGLLGVRFMWRIVTTIRVHLKFEKTAGQVGFMSWGILVSLLVLSVFFRVFTGYPISYFLDAALPGILMAHFWGRIGCTFYGCCYGKQAHNHCGLHYRHPLLKVIRTEHLRDKTVIPVQLFSGLYGLVGSLLILDLWSRNALPAGIPSAFVFLWYGTFRIDEEWLREQSVVWLEFISPAQVVSLILIMAALSVLFFSQPGQVIFYRAILEGQSIPGILGNMHPSILLGSGLLTALVFSYHYKEIGKWK